MRMLRHAVLLVAATATIVVGDATTRGDDAPVATAQTTTLSSGGEFHPLPPERIFDSRVQALDVAPLGKKASSLNGNDFTVTLAGKGGLPSVAESSKILAVVANVTVAEPTADGWLAVRPADAVRKPISEMSSLVNFKPGRNVPNLAIVGVDGSGRVTFTLRTNPSGRAHVIVDVLGWIATSSANQPGARLDPFGPSRLTDSRNAGQRPWGDGESRAIKVLGATTYQPPRTIPNDPSITAALINVTAVNNRPRRQPTYLAVSNQRLVPPVKTSTVNVVAGQIKAGLAVVPIGSDGNIHVYNHDGEIDVVIDVVGLFRTGVDPTTTTGRIVPLDAPFRVLDTRAAAFGNVPLGFGSTEDWSFSAFAQSVTTDGSAPLGGQSALLGNLTATDVRRIYPTVPIWSTYLTVFPGGEPRPASSNLNLGEGEVVPNMALVRYGTDATVQVYNHDGSVHYVLDAYAVVLS